MTAAGEADGPLRVLVAGGGVAGLEAVLALQDLAGDRVSVSLLAPAEHSPTARSRWPSRSGSAARARSRSQTSRATSASTGRVTRWRGRRRGGRGADGGGRGTALRRAARRGGCDAGRRRRARPDLVAGGRSGGLRRAAARRAGGLRQARRVRRAAGRGLAAADLRAGAHDHARREGHGHVARRSLVVTPEPEPLAFLGEEASAAIRRELAGRGHHAPHRHPGDRPHEPAAVRRPGDRRRAARSRSRRRGAARRRPRDPAAWPRTTRASSSSTRTGASQGARRTWAAGDGVALPIKFGGLATQQARRAAGQMARMAGADVPPASR